MNMGKICLHNHILMKKCLKCHRFQVNVLYKLDDMSKAFLINKLMILNITFIFFDYKHVINYTKQF